MPEGYRPNIVQPNQETSAPEQNPESLESALSPEALELIMAKVQDINRYGTAYTVIRGVMNDTEKLNKILMNGVLGTPIRRGLREKVTREKWVKYVREEKDAALFMNIMGTSAEEKMKETAYFEEKEVLAIVFDLNFFEEQQIDQKGQTNRTYSPRGLRERDEEQWLMEYRKFKESGFAPNAKPKTPLVSSSDGYHLSYRVAPKYFRGIILKLSRNLSQTETEIQIEISRKNWDKRKGVGFYDAGREAEDRERLSNQIVEDENLEHYQTKVQEIVSTMSAMNLDFVPVYDVNGDLLWPKQMSYDEVKKFVAERDAGKKETN